MKINKDNLSKKAKEAASKAKDKFQSAAEQVKKHDFRADMNDIAGEAKNLPNNWREFDIRNALRETAAEAKENPSSLWSKPETLREGKHFAFAGLALAVISLVLLLFTSNAFLGVVFLIVSVAGLCYSVVGLKTEGRSLATGGAIAGVLSVILAIGQIFTASESDSNSGNNIGRNGADDYSLLVENEGEEASSARKVISMAKNAKEIESLNFYGFYTGMSAKNAKLLREHYGLNSDHIWFRYNKVSGEVYALYFAAKAINKIMDVPNNFSTVECKMQEYFGINEWNNEDDVRKKEAIEEELQRSNNPSDRMDARIWIGDTSNVARKYKTADGVIVSLFPKGWNGEKDAKEVFKIYDSKRGDKANVDNSVFSVNNVVRNAHTNDVKTIKMLLPDGCELLMVEIPEEKIWKSEIPILKGQWEALMGKFDGSPNKDKSSDEPIFGWEGYDEHVVSSAWGKVVSTKDIIKVLNERPDVKEAGLIFWKTLLLNGKIFLVAETNDRRTERLEEEEFDKRIEEAKNPAEY